MIPISLITTYIKRGWWIVLLTATIAAVAGYQVASLQPNVYETNSSFIVALNTQDQNQDLGDSLYGIDTLSRQTTANTYAEIINSRKVFDLATDSLGLAANEEGQYSYQAVVLPETSVIRISVEGPDSKTATSLLQSIGDESISFIRDIYNVYVLIGLDAAQGPDSPISPNPTNSAILAAAIGTVLGLLLALLRTPELLSGYLNDPAQIGRPGSHHSEPIEYVYKNGHGKKEKQEALVGDSTASESEG